MTTPTEKRESGSAAALPERHPLEHERDELNRRLSEALARLAVAEAGAYSQGGAGGARHDQLAQELRTLKLQDFQGVCVRLYDFWKQGKNASERQQMRRALALTQFRKLLADQVLVQGIPLLLVRRNTDPAEDRLQAGRDIQASLFKTMNIQPEKGHLPEGLLTDLEAAITKGLDFIQAMALATPPGCLLVPSAGTAFNPAQHEAVAGCPTEGAVKIKLTVFPGYLPCFSQRALERALVYTVEAG